MVLFINRVRAQGPKPAIILLLWIGMFLPSLLQAQETYQNPALGIQLPEHWDPLVDIIAEKPFMGLHMNGARTPIRPLSKSLGGSVKREVEIDSTGQNVNITEKMGNMDFNLGNFLTLEQYVETRRLYELKESWLQSSVSSLSATSRRSGGSAGFRIDIPVEIKSKAFQQIFGSGTVGLDVSGEINIKGGFRNEDRSEVKSALNRGSDNSFKMEQTQRFKVQGHIGDKVTIGIDQDSERTFDFDNNIKLKYEGYEDEIIQSIEAGNIALSLPGTKFVTFGGQSNGLFGIKTEATIGALKLTAIASQEKGEKKRLELSGGATAEASDIQDYQYKTGVYYFVSEIYREQYKTRTAQGGLTYNPAFEITEFELYVSGTNYEAGRTESVAGVAKVIPDSVSTSLDQYHPEADRDKYRGFFVRLEKNQDYTFDEQLGFIRLNQRLSDDQVLGIAYKDNSGGEWGSLNFDPEESDTLYVRMIKNKDPRPADKTWDLEWKNVYDFGRGTTQDGFEMKIFYKPSSGVDQETVELKDGTTMTWLQFFGLDKYDENGDANPDNKVDMNDALISFTTGEVFFPDLRPFDPTREENTDMYALLKDDIRDKLLEPEIYDTTATNVINSNSNFYIQVNSQTSSSEYSLGMNVIENSEEVLLNGVKQNRGSDYTIDYFSGRLMILNDAALAANANLEISYESNQLFQIDKKTVMGLRAEYGLWDDSFIGATFLYLSENTLDQKVRVGKGPMRNMVWDVNTSLSFKPFFLTRFANFLPFVDTREQSTLKFDGEIAQIIPNPNTRNNDLTGDTDGVAYIDDFEASKRETPIGITHQSWEFCSPPVGKFDYGTPDLRERASMYYYTPYAAYPMKYIWPNRDQNTNVNNSLNILNLVYDAPDSAAALENYWNGIMKGLSSGYSDQTETKFLEIWVKVDSTFKTTGNATMHIDMGQISEDIIPNNKYDTEDIAEGAIDGKGGIRNGLLDEGEDVGLDGMSDSYAINLNLPGVDQDWWDLNGDNIKDPGEPWSNDNWRNVPDINNTKEPTDYKYIDGTENNENDGVREPDSEDLNGNGGLDIDNNYFSYSFSLNRNHPDTSLIAGKSIDNDTGDDWGWRMYRIPIQAQEPVMSIIGNPDLSLIEYMRIWVDGFNTPGRHVIQIAEINLVSSDWKEQGLAVYTNPDSFDVDQDSTVTVTVVNTHDNPEYDAPPGVQGEVDQITQVIAKEQSLVMRVTDLKPGYIGGIEKTFYEAQSYINYKTLKMFIYGYDYSARHIGADSTNIEVYLRMGADENNYYEIRQPVYEGWKKNNMEVDLIALSQLKVTADTSYTDPNNVNITIREKNIGSGVVWKLKGNPALTKIRMLSAGVENKHWTENSDGQDYGLFTGEIWLNELRLSNVKKDKGMAMRGQVAFKLADLVTVNAEMNKMDADFHNVQERFGSGDNEISGNISTTVQLGNFMPSKLGLRMPVTVTYSKSEESPKYIPGTDIEVNNDLPQATLDSIKTISERKGMNVSFGINSRSKNFMVKHIVTPLKVTYSRNETFSKNASTEHANNTSESGSVTWGLTFGQNNYVKPMKWLGTSPLLMKLADMKLYFSPKTITTSHASSRNKNNTLTYSGVSTKNGTFVMSRKYAMTMNITDSWSYDINRSYTHDLRGVNMDTLQIMLQEWKWGLLTNVDNSFNMKFNPKIFSWFTTNFTYNTTFKYGYNKQQALAPRSASQNRTLSASGDLTLSTLANSIYKPGGGNNRNRKSGGARAARPKPANGEEPKEEEKEGRTINIDVMKLTAGFLNVFEPFRISYNTRDNVSEYGLAGMPTLSYQFGISDTTGAGIEEALLSGEGSTSSFNRGSSSESKSTSVNSGLKLSRNMTFRFKYDQNSSLNTSSKTTTGQRSNSYYKDVGGPFPGWTVSVKGFEKLPFVKDYFTRVTLDHNFTGSTGETFDVEADTNGVMRENITKEDMDNSFRPLIGVTMAMKNGISLNFKYNTSDKQLINRSYSQTIKKTISDDISVTATYSKRGNFKIPLPFFGNKRLKNNIDISLTYSQSLNKQDDSKNGINFTTTSETSKWMLKPDVNYSFSDKVRGGLFFEVGKTHNKLLGDTSYKELGITVNIAIRGN